MRMIRLMRYKIHCIGVDIVTAQHVTRHIIRLRNTPLHAPGAIVAVARGALPAAEMPPHMLLLPLIRLRYTH